MRFRLFALWLLLSANTVFAGEVATEEEVPAQGETAASRGLEDVFKLSGYGTLGVVGSDNDRADFVTSVAQSNGAGHTRDWSGAVDSRLGVQLTFLPTDKFSAVLQLVSEQDYQSSWEPDVEWAFLQYKFTPNFTLRAGRMVLPTFMFSENRKVGFSLPWVRPPTDFYSVPNTSVDGIGAIYRLDIGELNYTLNATYGQDDSRFQGGSHSKSREAVTLSNTFDYGDTSFRLAYSRVKITLSEVDDLLSIYRAFGPEGEAIYDKFSAHDREFRLATLGLWHDTGKWFAGGEWSRAYTELMIPPGDSWYITGGYRYGKFTPYLTYSGTRQHFDNIPSLSGPPFVVGGLNALLGQLLRPVNQTTITAGTRWDFAENAAFKVQFDHIKPESNSSGTLTNVQPDYDLGDSVNLLSFSIDFIF